MKKADRGEFKKNIDKSNCNFRGNSRPNCTTIKTKKEEKKCKFKVN
jgi:hypothetical protein